MTSHGSRWEALALRAMMGLPPATVRWLAGRGELHDGQLLEPEVQWMLRIQRMRREPDVATLPIEDGRREILRQTSYVGGEQPIGEVRDLDVPGADGPMHARLYVPDDAPATSPLLVFLHGGGMVYGSLDSHDAVCRVLAERAGVRVLSLDYRLAPEHPFPAGLDDALAGYRWAVEHADELGADPARLAVGGDSAGGYLSAAVALQAAQDGMPCAFQLLVYPVTNWVEQSDSRRMFGEGYYLTQRFIDLAEELYLGDGDRRDPRVSVGLVEAVPVGLAPALVVTAGFDPLRDEGEAYAHLLAESGVDVELKRFPGQIHGFLNVVGVGRTSRAHVEEIADRLRAALVPAQ
ncbi:MAG: alpha/beta hydrolase [Nocardioidaceae bacterium]|nr:alpha/beta hydrolase [Nocardioidaceae bacterium]NUS50833.1 alpha/beta hydrolase [Nocardioidaceae bacterium]